MAKYKHLSLAANQSEIENAQLALDPLMAKAGIKEIKVGSEVLHLDNEKEKAKAPLADQINALASLAPVTGAQDISLVLANAEESAKIATAAQEKVETMQISLATLTREKLSAEEKLKTSEQTIASLTRDNADLTNRLDSAVKQVGKALSEQNVYKTALASKCLAANCLDLNGEDGKPLDKDADQATKMAAAMKLSHEDLFKAYNGAVNSAVAKTGVSFADIPSGKPAGVNEAKEVKGRARFAKGFKVAN